MSRGNRLDLSSGCGFDETGSHLHGERGFSEGGTNASVVWLIGDSQAKSHSLICNHHIYRSLVKANAQPTA